MCIGSGQNVLILIAIFNLLYSMGIAGVRSPDNVKFFDKKPLCVVYYDVDYTKNPKGTLLEREEEGGRD